MSIYVLYVLLLAHIVEHYVRNQQTSRFEFLDEEPRVAAGPLPTERERERAKEAEI